MTDESNTGQQRVPHEAVPRDAHLREQPYGVADREGESLGEALALEGLAVRLHDVATELPGGSHLTREVQEVHARRRTQAERTVVLRPGRIRLEKKTRCVRGAQPVPGSVL